MPLNKETKPNQYEKEKLWIKNLRTVDLGIYIGAPFFNFFLFLFFYQLI